MEYKKVTRQVPEFEGTPIYTITYDHDKGTASGLIAPDAYPIIAECFVAHLKERPELFVELERELSDNGYALVKIGGGSKS